jgi:hypothetical protein
MGDIKGGIIQLGLMGTGVTLMGFNCPQDSPKGERHFNKRNSR